MTEPELTPDVPWRVSCSPSEPRVVRLDTGTATVILPALEAHKMGSALHAASDLDAYREVVDDVDDATRRALQALRPRTDARQGDAVHGWGVWHDEDEEWIGFGATNGIAAELIPDGAQYAHLSLRPAVAHIAADARDEDYLTDDDLGGMTAEQANEFYADAANREPQGPPVQRPVNARPFSELRDDLHRRIADRDAERQRIWAAIQSWEETGLRIDGDGDLMPGSTHKPLFPFFDELHAIVFDTGHADENEPNFWHCRCGTRYHRGYLICPSCGTKRRTPESGAATA